MEHSVILPICIMYANHSMWCHAAPSGLRHPISGNSGTKVVLASPSDGCSAPDVSIPQQSILLAERGNCTFKEKALMAADAKAVGVIIVNNASDCLYPEIDDSPEELSSLFIASAPLDAYTQALIDAASAFSAGAGPVPIASYSSIRTVTLDPAAFLLLLLAVVTIIAAVGWAGSDYKKALADQDQTDSLNASNEGLSGMNNGQDGAVLYGAVGAFHGVLASYKSLVKLCSVSRTVLPGMAMTLL